jgi:hypothetical protein
MVDFAIPETSKSMEKLTVDIYTAVGHTDRTFGIYLPPTFYTSIHVGNTPAKLHCTWSPEIELGMAAMLSTTTYIC